MSDALEHEVKIIIDVISNLRQVTRELDAFNEEIGNTSKLDKMSARVGGLADSLDGLADSAKGANDALGVDKSNLAGWDALEAKVKAAAKAYEDLSKARAAGGQSPVDMDSFMAEQGLSRSDIANFRQGDSAAFLKDEANARKQVAKAADDMAEAERRLLAVQAQRAQTEAAESNRQMEVRAGLAARAKAEDDLARAIADRAAQQANADRASAYSTARTGSFMGQGATAGLSAGDTTWATDYERNMARARDALSAYDRELNKNTASYPANTSALAAMIVEEENAARAHEEQINALPRLRYALYDVATTAGVTATAIAGVGAAVLTTFGSMESAFTNVERTLSPEEFLNVEEFQAAVGEIRSELGQLSLEIPQSFQDLSRIATLGNQLEVPKESLVDFTRTIATFASITDVSVDEAAKAFGALQHTMDVPVDEFSNLASAITLVGRSSAATESEILSLVRELSRQAHGAGFTAQEVTALAGALGTLRIPPERSRGSLTTYFETLNRAVAEGGEQLQKFSSVIGVAPEALSEMVRNGEGVEILQRFLANLGDTSVEVSQNLSDLGLSQLRISDTFRGLAANAELFNKYLDIGRNGYIENIELQRQMGLMADDLASKWQFFLNALQLLSQAIGDEIAPAFGTLLDAATSLLSWFAQFAQSDVGGWMIRLVATIASLAAGFAALVAPLALAGASFAAFKTAMATIPWSTLVSGLRGLFLGSTAAAGGLRTLSGAAALATTALRIFARATIILAVLQAVSELVFNFNGSMIWLGETLQNVGSFLSQSAQAFGEWAGAILSVVSVVAPALSSLAGLLQVFGMGGVGDTLQSWGSGLADWGKSMESADSWMGDLNNTLDSTAWDDYAAGGYDFADALDDVGGAAGGAAAEVRTLVDYANDLQSVMQRAFDIRWGGQIAMDAITSGWHSIRDAARDAAEAVEEHQRKLSELRADKAIKEYWLSVAENYGDELRAMKLREELAKINADMAKEQQGLADAQDKSSMSLSGNSDAAIANRAALLGLLGDYQAYLQALAASGASQEELEAEARRLRAEFIRQATQMGFNRTEVERYAQSFDDMAKIIAQVPRNITITVYADPALQALAEFAAAARNAGTSAGNAIGGGVGSGVRTAEQELRRMIGLAEHAAMMFRLSNPFLFMGGNFSGGGGGGGYSGGRAHGGYAGDGGKYEAMGTYHGGEFIFTKEATSAIGVNNLTRMQAAATTGQMPALPVGNGIGSGGPMDLSAASIRMLAQVLSSSLSVVLPGDTLAGSVGSHNTVSGRRGAA